MANRVACPSPTLCFAKDGAPAPLRDRFRQPSAVMRNENRGKPMPALSVIAATTPFAVAREPKPQGMKSAERVPMGGAPEVKGTLSQIEGIPILRVWNKQTNSGHGATFEGKVNVFDDSGSYAHRAGAYRSRSGGSRNRDLRWVQPGAIAVR